MKIVVLVKHIPCAADGLSFAPDLTLNRATIPTPDQAPAPTPDRSTSPNQSTTPHKATTPTPDHAGGLSEADEAALAVALAVARRRREVQVTAVTMGPAAAAIALRRALVLGADDGVHVRDDRLHGCDALGTSRVLAAAVRRLGYDLVLCGSASTDAGTGVVPAMVAERLGVPALCCADTVTVRERRAEIRRDEGTGALAVTAGLPAVVSVTERGERPRYPRYPARVEARNKLVRTWSLSDLGIDPAPTAATVVRRVTPRRRTGPVLVQGDPTSAAVRVADFLAERRFL